MHFSFKFTLLLFCSIIVFKHGLCQHHEGDSCSLPSSGVNGICKLISLCKSAVDSLQNDESFPKTCGLKNTEPIICCAADSVRPGDTILFTPPNITTSTTRETSTTPRIQTTPSITTQKVNLKVGDKSRQKCKEYERLIFQQTSVILTVLNSPIQQIYKICSLEPEIYIEQPVKHKEFPHMALIGFEDDDNVTQWECSGSLISETFVLSAAHCTFHQIYQEPKYILLGKLHLNSDTDDAQSQKILIKKIIIHPKYTHSSRYHDIALYELKNKPILNSYTRPACLNTNPTLTNRLAVASGWGQISTYGEVSDSLHKVTLDMFTNADCKKSFKRNLRLTNGIDDVTQFCAGSQSESKDICQLFIGDLCTLLSSGTNGTCKSISSCQSGLDALENQGIIPKHCGFKNKQPIICCAGSSVRTSGTRTAAPPIISTSTTTVTSKARRIQTNPSATTQRLNLKVGDQSRQKCKEYQKYTYQRPGVNTISDSSSVPPVVYCPIAVIETIIGGQPAKSKEFPHMALVGFENHYNVMHWDCGCSLISETFVLLAGHCTYSNKHKRKPKYILLGELVLNSTTDDAHPQKIPIKEIKLHPKYTPFSKYHDIALFELQNEPKLNTYTRPACLNTNPTLTNRLGVASGWGLTTFYGEGSNALKVTLGMFTNADCKKSFSGNNKLANGIDEDTQFCAGSRTESKDTCQGDSGGPLQVRNSAVNCGYNIIGITSFGKECGNNNPGVYTRVSSYIKWIEDTVWPQKTR